MPDVEICRIGPQPGERVYVPDTPNNRDGTQAREPSKCLKERSYRDTLAKEAF